MLSAAAFEEYYGGTGSREVGCTEYSIEQLIAGISTGPADYVAAMGMTKAEVMMLYFARRAARGGDE